MSRGGKAGAGRGRGPPGTARIGGVDIPLDDEIQLSDRPQPTALFPPYRVVPPSPLTAIEKRQVARFKAVRDRIHEGPLYTVFSDTARVSKASNRMNTAAANFDPFEGMQTYSQKYIKRRRRIPKLDERPYVLKFFPKELWSTLDPSHAADGTEVSKPKKLLLSITDKTSGLNIEDREAAGEVKEAVDGADEEEEEIPEPDDDPPEEELDDNYEDDESEGMDDYNAEQYFDDGGDDGGDGYDDGDGGGGDEL